MAQQATFDDLGVPLSDVTFCCIDVETTGGAPPDARIMEIGAVKYRGGERLGTFQSLVDPGTAIPRFITHLTGLDEVTLVGAPGIESVLPALVEFMHGTVFVAHNAPFDLRFIAHDLERLAYEPIPGPAVCTAKLARRVLGTDVPNVRLGTLADYFRTAARPSHRALEDAEACAEVLHRLLDAGGRLGILTLGDLREAMRARGQPNYRKIRLADDLPSAPGVYIFRRAPSAAGAGGVLYVGKAKDVRARVRSYFYGDNRRKIQDLLAETGAVEAIPCRTEVEALVLEARLIRRHGPPYNRRGKGWRRYAYLKLDLAEAWPRLKVVGSARGHGAFLGPFRSRKAAALVKDALEDVFPIRRCTRSMGKSTQFAPCALADLGRCVAPCDGRVTLERYEELVRSLQLALSSPGGLLEALEERMRRLADTERYEEAALVRNRLQILVATLSRMRSERWLVEAGRLSVEAPGGRVAFVGGALDRDGNGDGFSLPLSTEAADEVRAASRWLAAAAPRVVSAERPLAEPLDGGAALARLRGLLAESEGRTAPPD